MTAPWTADDTGRWTPVWVVTDGAMVTAEATASTLRLGVVRNAGGEPDAQPA